MLLLITSPLYVEATVSAMAEGDGRGGSVCFRVGVGDQLISSVVPSLATNSDSGCTRVEEQLPAAVLASVSVPVTPPCTLDPA